MLYNEDLKATSYRSPSHDLSINQSTPYFLVHDNESTILKKYYRLKIPPFQAWFTQTINPYHDIIQNKVKYLLQQASWFKNTFKVAGVKTSNSKFPILPERGFTCVTLISYCNLISNVYITICLFKCNKCMFTCMFY